MAAVSVEVEIYGGYAPLSTTALGSAVASGHTQVLKEIRMVNTGSSTATCTLYKSGTTKDKQITIPVSLAPNQQYIEQCWISMVVGSQIYAAASIASTITLSLSGVNTTL